MRNVARVEVAIFYDYTTFHYRLGYAVLSWGGCTHSKRVFSLQKFAIRNITGFSRRASCRAYFSDLGIFTFTPSLWRMSGKLLPSLTSYNVIIYEKSPIYSGIKVYSNLPKVY